MASAAENHHKGFRRLLHLKDSRIPADRNPLIPVPASPPPAGGRKSFAAAAFRGLGCASAASSQVFSPAAAAAAVRTSADWSGKRPRRRRAKQKRSAAAAEVWCAPRIAFPADASVDCVAPHHQMPPRGRPDLRERACVARRGRNQERVHSFMDSPPHEEPFFGSDPLPSGRLQLRRCRRSPGGLEELVMFQTRILLGAMDAYDQYRDMRIDVDSMSYEELLELGDKIGYVNTGLREEEILCCLRRTKPPFFNASPFRFSEIERKCTICQEEYEVNDEIGRLGCGHNYHIYCVKQWLRQKNACPVCKTAVTES